MKSGVGRNSQAADVASCAGGNEWFFLDTAREAKKRELAPLVSEVNRLEYGGGGNRWMVRVVSASRGIWGRAQNGLPLHCFFRQGMIWIL